MSKSLISVNMFSTPTYDPNAFVDWLVDVTNSKNDAALCRLMNVAPPVVSKIRHGRMSVGDSFVIRAHIRFGVPVRKMYARMGIPLPDQVMRIVAESL